MDELEEQVAELGARVVEQEKDLKKIKELLEELIRTRLKESQALEEFVRRLHY